MGHEGRFPPAKLNGRYRLESGQCRSAICRPGLLGQALRLRREARRDGRSDEEHLLEQPTSVASCQSFDTGEHRPYNPGILAHAGAKKHEDHRDQRVHCLAPMLRRAYHGRVNKQSIVRRRTIGHGSGKSTAMVCPVYGPLVIKFIAIRTYGEGNREQPTGSRRAASYGRAA
jgi:hypothetical protein